MRTLLAVLALLTFVAPTAAQRTYYGPTVDVQELMVPGPLGDKVLGDPNAPVTIIEYASMTCPHCQRFHTETYPTLKAKYIDTGKVKFVLREFPLDSLAFGAFMLARCTGDQYFPVIDTLFDRQEEWAFARDPVTAIIGVLHPFGIGDKEFDTCIADQALFEHIDDVAARGSDIFGVDGTPTFFVNGRRAVGELSPVQMDRLIATFLGTPG
jgi:protein-disulfide isomerase